VADGPNDKVISPLSASAVGAVGVPGGHKMPVSDYYARQRIIHRAIWPDST